MLELPPLPADLPWAVPAYLLLDGVSVPDLLPQLRRWGRPIYCLYLNTRWHELSDISPCLVALEGSGDPLLTWFGEHAALEWGYLLFSAANVQTLLEHWRRLLSVEQADGVAIMPRIADPAVMHQLLRLAEQGNSARWFGPVAHVCLPDGVEGAWHQHRRLDQARAEPQSYRLTDQELTALGEVEFRNVVSGLSGYLQEYFPAFMASFAPPERRQYAQELTSEAYRQGFSTEQDVTLYAIVFACLAGQPVTEHPDIAQLLAGEAVGTPLARAERAAELAVSRANDRQGGLS